MLAGHRGLDGAESAPFHLRSILVELLGRVLERRVEDGVPGDFTAAVGGFTAHDGGEGAVGDVLSFVQLSVVEDGIDEVNVLLSVGIAALQLEGGANRLLTFDLSPAARIRDALGAVDLDRKVV